jgi:diaminopimelate epimerase
MRACGPIYAGKAIVLEPHFPIYGRMTAPSAIRYAKMNGLGNEIVVVDLRGTSKRFTAEEAAAIAARPETHFDQMMVLHDPPRPGLDAQILIYNTDGSLAEACGNGMRCVGLIAARDTGRTAFAYETDGGIRGVRLESPASISVDMGEPRFGWQDIPLSEPFHDTRRIELQVGPADKPIMHSPAVVNVGNPHAIFWVDDPAAIDLGRIGPMLEYHPLFPERANISIARIDSREAITLRTWERGAGLTRACGSAACGAAVSAARIGLTERKVTVTLPGGPLVIVWRADNCIIMTGPAELEHEGTLDQIPLVAAG